MWERDSWLGCAPPFEVEAVGSTAVLELTEGLFEVPQISDSMKNF